MADINSTPPSPVNYTGLQIQPDPVGSFLKPEVTQSGINLQNAQAQQAQAQAGMIGAQTAMQGIQIQRQIQYPQMLQQALQNPTPANFAALSAMFPDQHQAISSAYTMSRQQQQQDVVAPMAQAYVSLLNGRSDLALDIVQKQREALVNSGANPNDPQFQQKLQHADSLIQQIQTDPKAAAGLMGATLSSYMPADQFASTFSDYMKQPATLAKANADATVAQAKAATAPAQAVADLGLTHAQTQNIASEMQNRASTFNLDQQKFQTETALKLRELDYQQNVPNMRGDTANIVNSAAMDSVQHGMQADRIGQAMSNIDSLKQQGRWTQGSLADMRAAGQSIVGSQDDWNSMRTEYNALRNGSIFSSVQGGRTTDADLKVLQQGFPSANAGPDQIEQFLTSMRNVELRQARADEGKAAWGSAYGYMGPATHDATVGGQQVGKGTSYSAFIKNRIATLSTAPSSFDAPTAGPGVQTGGQQGGAPAANGAPAQSGNALARYSKYMTSGQ